ncbi:MAG TPA: histidine kinase [Bryobacteraceae bacterium]|jgi:sensor histidine kinase YesM
MKQESAWNSWGLKSRWSHWIAAALFWTVIGLLFSLPRLSAANWRQPLEGMLTQWWAWGLVTPLIILTDEKLPFREKELGMRVLAHLPVSVVLTLVYFYLLGSMAALLSIGNNQWHMLLEARTLSNIFSQGFLWSWPVYWVIFGARQTFLYYEHYKASELRLERMERSFSEARLNALRMQLDPHFLFNALNTISSQVEREPRLARTMLEHLGDLLRLSLEVRDRQEIPLAEELAFLDHYLAIQKIRFGSHLIVETRVAPEVKYALVPCLIVQPLVENAIRHGISRRAAGGSVMITATGGSERLEIRVEDDGVGLPEAWTPETSSGLGLSITRQRIAWLHPNGNSGFAVRRREGGGTEVEISLPLRLAVG